MSNETTHGNESVEPRIEQAHLVDGGIIVATDNGGLLEGDGDACACDELLEGVPRWPCYRDGARFDD